MKLFNLYFINILKTKYAQINGRATRSEYWYFVLFTLASYLALGLICAMFHLTKSSFYVLFAFLFVMTIPFICVTIRRLHDIGRSGWYYFFVLIPVIGTIILFIFLFTESDYGINKYGPNPTGIGNNQDL